MSILSKYRGCIYKPGGRGPNEFDCWGIVRHIRRHEYGLHVPPSYSGAEKYDKRYMTRAFSEEMRSFSLCSPTTGAIALAWKGGLAIHCAIVVEVNDKPGILECDKGIGVKWQTIRSFESKYTKVEYFT